MRAFKSPAFSNHYNSLPYSAFKMHNLPQIIRDTTLAKLYTKDSTKCEQEQSALVLCASNSEVTPTAKLARNSKFLYQENTFSSTSIRARPKQDQELQRTIAVKHLSLVLQHDAFVAAGYMLAIQFNLDSPEASTARSEEKALQTVSILIPLERPRLQIFSSLKQSVKRQNGVDRSVAKTEIDGPGGFPLSLALFA